MTPLSTSDPIPFLDLVTPHRDLEEELVASFRAALHSAAFVGGPEVQAFEEAFATFAGTPWCAGVNSGTDALRFAIQAMDIAPGDEVITVPHTFIATTEAITQAGGTPRFVDVDEETMTMDPAALEAAVTSRTVGVIPVHLYGHPADMDPIRAVAARHGLWVIEDAAQAHGARYRERVVGSLADLSCFSFYPGKNLGSCGEGGAVCGTDTRRLAVVRQLREHGQRRKYDHVSEGYNGRLHAIQAGFLRIKLPRMGEWTEGRRRAATRYREALAGMAQVRLPTEAAWAHHVYHLYVIRAERRDALQEHLGRLGIGTGLHYPVPLHLQPAYTGLGYRRGEFPVTERICDALLSLPMFPTLQEAQTERVASAVRTFYAGESSSS